MLADDIAKACGVSIPDTFLTEAETVAAQYLSQYGCSDNAEAVRAMAYVLLLNDRDILSPCLRKMHEYLIFLCPAIADDLVF